MGSKQYQHPYKGKWRKITVACTPKTKMKFDEICTEVHKSKTEIINTMIKERYRELFLDK
jgi:hypothetical protein